jgi:hypothetical protein
LINIFSEWISYYSDVLQRKCTFIFSEWSSYYTTTTTKPLVPNKLG